ncbi:hypothetical protein KFL_000230170 [Klebsormidium nitens]|uniref:Uncharacterized protein n=1 Tax=Klebsormidium nitens TaxID=105231 RepID=A0A1Y1HR42_KLENI|nr:hypothetical protein KFL_000230170 [Klebsormidium nitens]|eukprot:GAQ79037.1 hypothetical protein KFL_000230170 [Klebsormidium nitens]
MASLPQHSHRNMAVPAALLLVLLLRFSPSCVSFAAPAAAPAVVPTPAPTPLQCPPGQDSYNFNGTQCCTYRQTCRTGPIGSREASDFTAVCCPDSTVCVLDASPFAACVTPPPEQCTACLPFNSSDPFGNAACNFANFEGEGRFCCGDQQCGGGSPTDPAFCCDQGDETQCTYPIQGIASPTAGQRCCKPGRVICNDRCCAAANCVPVAGAGTLGPYTCNEQVPTNAPPPPVPTATGPFPTFATKAGAACDPSSSLPFTCYNDVGSSFACCPDPKCPFPGPVAKCAGDTSPTVTGTPAPTATTAAPAVTTAAPAVTTAAPAVTTAAPAVTTAAPVTTGAPAPSVTYATGSGSACDPNSALRFTCFNNNGSSFACCPDPQCPAPGPVARCAGDPTAAPTPAATTGAPAVTTAAPAVTTAAPAVTTAAPVVTGAPAPAATYATGAGYA